MKIVIQIVDKMIQLDDMNIVVEQRTRSNQSLYLIIYLLRRLKCTTQLTFQNFDVQPNQIVTVNEAKIICANIKQVLQFTNSHANRRTWTPFSRNRSSTFDVQQSRRRVIE